MSNEEQILQVLTDMNGNLVEINKRLDKIEEELADLKEDSTITRTAVNTVAEWTEHASAVVQVPYPYKPA